MATISYGKERPVCTEKTEECHKLNRHVEFKVKTRELAKTEELPKVELPKVELPQSEEAPKTEEGPTSE
jgi:hypothetical protein